MLALLAAASITVAAPPLGEPARTPEEFWARIVEMRARHAADRAAGRIAPPTVFMIREAQPSRCKAEVGRIQAGHSPAALLRPQDRADAVPLKLADLPLPEHCLVEGGAR
jgi:hypothetical protein